MVDYRAFISVNIDIRWQMTSTSDFRRHSFDAFSEVLLPQKIRLEDLVPAKETGQNGASEDRDEGA